MRVEGRFADAAPGLFWGPMSEPLPQDLQRRLGEYLAQLRDYPWFSTAGAAMRNGPRAANLAEAYFGDWRPRTPGQQALKREHWAAATQALEQRARQSLGEAPLVLVFREVRDALEALLWNALSAYLERVTAAGTALDPTGEHAAVAIDAHQAILRDVSWAAVERVTGDEGFFCALLPWYRDGRWPCGWTGAPARSRPVIL